MEQPIRTVTDDERRARLALRHGLAQPVPDTLAAASAVVCLHATEPSSVYLSAWARSAVSRADVDRALYADRTIVRQLAMRRTVFGFPRELLPAVRGSAAARVAAQQSAQLAKSVVSSGIATDGMAWVEQTCAAVTNALRRAPTTTTQLRNQLPELTKRVPPAGQPKAAATPVASQVMTVLAASGKVVRGMNNGNWKVSRPCWTLAEDWLSEPVQAASEAEGYAELVSHWLWSFGPGTEEDIVWWLGATKTIVRQALADIHAITVRLENGSLAWLRQDDSVEILPHLDRWVGLLPTLDPTTMGWRQRDFYVDKRLASLIYDRAGNGTPTAWLNGRIVGAWKQNEDGKVVIVPMAALQKSDLRALQNKAEELTAWLGGDIIRSSIKPPFEST